jgi:hypothetical protein
MRQVHKEHMHLLPNTADRLTEIDLSVPRRMRQRHKGLAGSRPRKPHTLLHGRVAAIKTVLQAEPVINPLGGYAAASAAP